MTPSIPLTVNVFVEDAQLALEATNGASDVALDVVMLLHDLDMDGVGVMQMGVYHSPASVPLPASPTPSQSSPALAYSASFIDSPPFPIVEQRVNGSAKPDNDGGWQTVKPRPPKPPLVHPAGSPYPSIQPPECVIWEIKREGQGKAGVGQYVWDGREGRRWRAWCWEISCTREWKWWRRYWKADHRVREAEG